MTSGSLWNYHRNEINDPASKNNDAYNYRIYNNKTTTIKSFEYKTKIIGRTPNNNNISYPEVVVPLKYLSNFWRFLSFPLINCELTVNSLVAVVNSRHICISQKYLLTIIIMPVLTKRQLNYLSQEELLDYAEKVGNIEKPEKSVAALSKKFDNITDEFKKVNEEFKETKEELSRIRAEKLDIKAQLTKMEILTNNVAQYSRRECLELHEVLSSTSDQDLGEKVVQVFLCQ